MNHYRVIYKKSTGYGGFREYTTIVEAEDAAEALAQFQYPVVATLIQVDPTEHPHDELVQLLVADLTDDVTCGMSDLIARENRIAALCGVVGAAGIRRANAAAYQIIKSTPFLVSGAPNDCYEAD